MNRERFLGHIEQCLREASPPSAPERYRPREAPPRRELVERFTAEAEAVGAKVYRVASLQDARREAVNLLRERGVRRVIRSVRPELVGVRIDTGLAALDIEVRLAEHGPNGEGADELRADAFDADAGITTADFGIASTGTLVLLTAPGN